MSPAKPYARLSVGQRRELRNARQRFERAWGKFRELYPSDSPACLHFEREYQALLESIGMVGT